MDDINVLLIDDSNIVHVLLAKTLAEQKGIKVIGNAYNGKEGVELVKRLTPHVIIMDIGMPEMDGLEAIEQIMYENPVPIIVFSGASKDTVDLSFKAIGLGAVDIIEKPSAPDLSTLKEFMETRLVRSIRTFADFHVMRRIKKPLKLHTKLSSVQEKEKPGDGGEHIKKHRSAPEEQKPATHHGAAGSTVPRLKTDAVRVPRDRMKGAAGFPVIGIAASTGGPQTVRHLLESLTKTDIRAGIVVVQHMAEGFMQGYSDWLGVYSALPVVIPNQYDPVRERTVYVAPGDFHLGFDDRGRFLFIDSPPILGIRPSANIMFAHLARTFGTRAVGVILTGMGDDGTNGLREVKARGGYIISQDEDTSLVFGMPKAAIEAGIVDRILPLNEIAEHLVAYCSTAYEARSEK